MSTIWECKTCKVSIPNYPASIDKVRKHLKTKKHKKYRAACTRCQSLRLVPIEGECWDSDGMRRARKCLRCKTEFKMFASGMQEKTDPNEYDLNSLGITCSYTVVDTEQENENAGIQ